MEQTFTPEQLKAQGDLVTKISFNTEAFKSVVSTTPLYGSDVASLAEAYGLPLSPEATDLIADRRDVILVFNVKNWILAGLNRNSLGSIAEALVRKTNEAVQDPNSIPQSGPTVHWGDGCYY